MLRRFRSLLSREPVLISTAGMAALGARSFFDVVVFFALGLLARQLSVPVPIALQFNRDAAVWGSDEPLQEPYLGETA